MVAWYKLVVPQAPNPEIPCGLQQIPWIRFGPWFSKIDALYDEENPRLPQWTQSRRGPTLCREFATISNLRTNGESREPLSSRLAVQPEEQELRRVAGEQGKMFRQRLSPPE